jgi:nicotinate-nucleotide adenylyltransferase
VRIGVLGGSFDPVHHGHLIAARSLREELELDLVVLIPAGQQPFKRDGHGASATERATMAELAVAGEAGLAVDRIEVERAGPSYTVDTLAALQARRPDADWTLLVGADAAAEFPAWRSAERIRGLARVVAFTRAGSDQPGTDLPVVKIPAVEISSTDIRARVRAGRSIRYLVPDVVADYIAAGQLYTARATTGVARDGENAGC